MMGLVMAESDWTLGTAETAPRPSPLSWHLSHGPGYAGHSPAGHARGLSPNP